MVTGYDRAIARALGLQPPEVALPAHLRPAPERHAQSLIRGMLDQAIF
jgi:hypothetical protein